jgi:predicted ATPase
MKLHLRNIGPIDTIDIDVDSDLTFIYGKNNIGKSYAITILYLVLRNFAFDFSSANNYPYGFLPEKLFEDDTNDKIKDGADVDITDDITQCFSSIISITFLSRFENSLYNSFGDISNLKNKISNDPLELCMEFEEYDICIIEKNNKLSVKYNGKGKKYICRKAQRYRNPRIENNQIILYYIREDQLNRDIYLYFNKLYTESISSIKSRISDVFYLPASRSGLYRALNAFSQILVELAKKRNFLREKIVLPSISEQDSDYFSKINEINIKRTSQKYNPIAENIEKNLLKGKVSFDQATKQILFHPNNTDIDLELLGTSSMIAEVSPIVLYLRYIIGSDEYKIKFNSSGVPIIFIEEPEAHLHPDAQTLLMECFVDLVKMGVKLVITSHSNYMFIKLNNLIANKQINREIINGTIFFQGKKGSCSNRIPMSDIGMEDNNFVEVAEKLYYEKIQIIEKMDRDNAERT